MQSRVLRWIASLAGVALSCAMGAWLYLMTAFGIGFGAGLGCLLRNVEPGSCLTHAEIVRVWSWTVASGAVSGIGSVLLAVIAAPTHRRAVRLLATLVPPIAWLWFCSWNVADSAVVTLASSSLGGGLASWLALRQRVALTPETRWDRGWLSSRPASWVASVAAFALATFGQVAVFAFAMRIGPFDAPPMLAAIVATLWLILPAAIATALAVRVFRLIHPAPERRSTQSLVALIVLPAVSVYLGVFVSFNMWGGK